MKRKAVRIGTRGSKLAVWQAEWVINQLRKIDNTLDYQMVKIKTTGDKILDVPLAKVGGKGLFVKEIEEAILRNDVDLAVHSMKDVPSELPEGLHLSVVCRREDVRDAIIFKGEGQTGNSLYKNLFDLPNGAIVGTSSLRRMCQLLNIRRDLVIKALRGNLDTRLKRLQEGLYDAIVLASAGLMRLGWADRIHQLLNISEMIPAVGQGAIGVECRVDDVFINELLSHINHEETSICVRAERAFLKRLEGGCQVPIGANAIIDGKEIAIIGFVGSVDGKRIIKEEIQGDLGQPEKTGIILAETILSKGGRDILREVYQR